MDHNPGAGHRMLLKPVFRSPVAYDNNQVLGAEQLYLMKTIYLGFSSYSLKNNTYLILFRASKIKQYLNSIPKTKAGISLCLFATYVF